MKTVITILLTLLFLYSFCLQVEYVFAAENLNTQQVTKLVASEKGVFVYPVLSIDVNPIGELPPGVEIEVIRLEKINGQTWFLIQPKGIENLRRGWVPATNKLKLVKKSKSDGNTTIETIENFPKALLSTQPKKELEKKEPEWKMDFTAEQKESLKKWGCLFDDLDQKISNRLASRGFSSEHFVQAYGEWKAMGFTNRLEIQRIAIVYYLNIPISEYKNYRYYYDDEGEYYTYTQGDPGVVTDFYNYRIGGKWPWLIGAAAIGVGSGATIVGLGVLLSVSGCNSSCDSFAACSTCRDNEQLGYVIGGVGLATIGGGLGLFIPNHNKVRRWAPNKSLDNGTTPELEQYKQSKTTIHSNGRSEHGLLSLSDSELKERSSGYYLNFVPFISEKSSGLILVFKF